MIRLSVVALLPPGSVEADVGKVQQSIFIAHGSLSAIALPPLVPICFIPSAAEPGRLLRDLNARASAPYRIRFDGVRRHAGFLYLALDSAGVWKELRDGVEKTLPDGEGLFPGFEGFFLGCAEQDQDPAVPDAAASPGEAALSDSSFSSCRLALVDIETPRGRDSWWREVSWEIVEEIPLRGRRSS